MIGDCISVAFRLDLRTRTFFWLHALEVLAGGYSEWIDNNETHNRRFALTDDYIGSKFVRVSPLIDNGTRQAFSNTGGHGAELLQNVTRNEPFQ